MMMMHYFIVYAVRVTGSNMAKQSNQVWTRRVYLASEQGLLQG